MREILPGVHHWTTVHARWDITIHSYWLAQERVLIDPRVPDEGLEWFADGPPVAALLTNRHHYRDSGRFHERFGCPVLCNRLGLHEFGAGEPVEGFDPGDALPGGVVALEVGGICPDESALHIPAHRAVAVADGVVRYPTTTRCASCRTRSWTTPRAPRPSCATPTGGSPSSTSTPC